MRMKCGGIFYYRFARNLLLSRSLKNFENRSALAKLEAKIEWHLFLDSLYMC